MQELLTMSAERAATNKPSWLKRLGWVGFLFFLIKGLVWLALFFGVGSLWAG